MDILYNTEFYCDCAYWIGDCSESMGCNAIVVVTQVRSGHVKEGDDNPSRYKRCRVEHQGPST